MRRPGFWERLWSLFRGISRLWLKSTEAKNAEAVFESAIAGQLEQHDRLHEAAARLIALRNRMARETERLAHERELLDAGVREAALADRDAEALALLARQRQVEEQLQRLGAESGRIQGQAEQARQGLTDIRAAVRRLQQERAQLLARREYALARRSVEAVMRELANPDSLSASESALGNVRRAIEELEEQNGLDELDRDPSEDRVSLPALERRRAGLADQEKLARLKAELRGRLLSPAPSEKTDPAPAELVVVR
jgi:phage shock protein A